MDLQDPWSGFLLKNKSFSSSSHSRTNERTTKQEQGFGNKKYSFFKKWGLPRAFNILFWYPVVYISPKRSPFFLYPLKRICTLPTGKWWWSDATNLIYKIFLQFLQFWNMFFKYLWPNPGIFLVYFRPILITITISAIQIEKSVDGVLGIWTWGCRMVDADDTTELWQLP